jgi:hypothetical protein
MLLMGLPSLAMAGIISQFVATKRDQRKLDRAPGEMVSVGSHKLHIRCMDEGSHGGGMMAHSGVEAEQTEQAAQTLQSELANLSSNSTRNVIEGSDHGSVITNQHHAKQTSEEILKVVEAVRTGQSLEEQ